MPLQRDERVLDMYSLNQNCAKCLDSSPHSKPMLKVAQKMALCISLKTLQNLYGKPSKTAVFPFFSELMVSSTNAFFKKSFYVCQHVGHLEAVKQSINFFMCISIVIFLVYIITNPPTALSFCLLKVISLHHELQLHLLCCCCFSF